MQKEISPKFVVLAFGVLAIAFLAAFYALSWQEPTQAPPGGNVPAPINVGTDPQAKAGRISATEFYDYNNPAYYLNPSGQSVFETLCMGADCRTKWPETGAIITNVIAGVYSTYDDGEYYSKSVSYDCPAGGELTSINCTQILFDGKNFCSCVSSNNKATVKAYVRSEYSNAYPTTNAVDYCVNDVYTKCYTVGPCQWEFQCGIKQIIRPPVAYTETLLPNGAGDLCNISYQEGCLACPNHYTCVDEAAADGGNTSIWQKYLSSAVDLYALADTTVGSGKINKVIVKIKANDFGQVRTVIKTYGTIYYGAWVKGPGTGLYAWQYKTHSTEYVTNPYTGSAWTWQEVNALQAGAEIASGESDTPRVTRVYVVVDYTP